MSSALEDRAAVRAALEAVSAEIWQSTRNLSARQREIIAEAEAEGKLTVGTTYVAERQTRLKPRACSAKSGAELLAVLGLSKEIYK